MKKFLSILFVSFALSAAAIAPVCFIACKQPQIVATYKTLATVQVTVDEAREAFVDANAQGIVSPEAVAKALDLNAKFHAAYAVAITAAGTAQSPSPANVTTAASEFISLVYSFIRK